LYIYIFLTINILLILTACFNSVYTWYAIFQRFTKRYNDVKEFKFTSFARQFKICLKVVVVNAASRVGVQTDFA